MDKKKYIIGAGVVILMVASGSFYAGSKYGARNFKLGLTQGQNQQTRAGINGNPQRGAMQGEQAGSQQRQGGMRSGLQNGGPGDFVSGEIISKDETSATIKTVEGGSRVVFFSDKTFINKAATGAVSDLSVGQQVVANGKMSSDGTLAAQDIQIRPAK